jgi:hypothetical protein
LESASERASRFSRKVLTIYIAAPKIIHHADSVFDAAVRKSVAAAKAFKEIE